MKLNVTDSERGKFTLKDSRTEEIFPSCVAWMIGCHCGPPGVLKLQFGHIMRRQDALEKKIMLRKVGAPGKEEDENLGGRIAEEPNPWSMA